MRDEIELQKRALAERQTLISGNSEWDRLFGTEIESRLSRADCMCVQGLGMQAKYLCGIGNFWMQKIDV